MGKKSKRARTLLKRMSILGEKIDPKVLKRYGLKSPEDNSVMQERLKEEKVEVAPDTVFTPEIVESLVEEVEEAVEKVQPKPKKTTRTRKPRTRKKKTE